MRRYILAIKTFPTPRNIHDVRSGFSLINQVAYCFAESKVMKPFRHLLSPKNKFLLDRTMDKAFVASKLEIVKLKAKGRMQSFCKVFFSETRP